MRIADIFRLVPTIPPPDFSEPRLANAPDARFVPAPADGVLPEDFFSTTNLPTYVRVRGEWLLPREPRMDAALVIDRNGELWVRGCAACAPGSSSRSERRKTAAKASSCIRRSPLATTTGVQVHGERGVAREAGGLCPPGQSPLDERERGGYIVWVTGPALVHSRARADMTWFIMNGFVSALLAGNAVAVHDIEASIFGTTLGMSGSGETTVGGHGLHMRAINKVRAAGSIPRAVEAGVITDGIMHACVRKCRSCSVARSATTVRSPTCIPICRPRRTP